MIEKLTLGRTGHESTRILFGAAALWAVTQEEADGVLELLLEYGINHIDTARSYGDAELRIAPWMSAHRDKFFLATKSDKRTKEAAWSELRESFERMQVDYVDLWQMHFLVDEDEWQTAMGPGGALEAFIEAKEQGLARYIGVTGHDVAVPSMHMRSLERYDFDSVLLPYNYPMMQNPQYAADFEALYAICQERNIAFQTIKSLSRGPWGDKEQTRSTWYEPFEDQADIDRAVHWVLSRPGTYLNSTGDIHILPRLLDAAARFQPPESMAALEAEIAATEGIAPLFT